MTTDAEPQRVVIPIVEETVEVAKHAHRTGSVHIHRRVHQDTEVIDEPLETTEVVVERVPVGRWVDIPPAERQEGDTTIIPVIMEVAVIEKRLRLVEEVHVTRKRTIRHYRDRVNVRRTEIAVERDGVQPPERTSGQDSEPVNVQPLERHQSRRDHMTTTVIGLFKTPEPARRARGDLIKNGCPEDAIRLFDRQQDSMVNDLATLGIDEEDGKAFAGAVAKGAAVIAVEIADVRADSVRAVLERNEAHGVDSYADEEQRHAGGDRATLQEAEERVEIGKRRVVQGAVRATTHVSERPVEKRVELEEEKVHVRHREAARDLSPEEAEHAFREGSVEMSETAEEAEVRKAARLIGEVEVSKTVKKHPETVKETVRKTEVDVERIDPKHR